MKDPKILAETIKLVRATKGNPDTARVVREVYQELVKISQLK